MQVVKNGISYLLITNRLFKVMLFILIHRVLSLLPCPSRLSNANAHELFFEQSTVAKGFVANLCAVVVDGLYGVAQERSYLFAVVDAKADKSKYA
jgi:hypothetical protein